MKRNKTNRIPAFSSLNFKVFFLYLVLSLFYVQLGAQSKAHKPGHILIFQDEFNHGSYDRSFWENKFPYGRHVKGLHYATNDENFAYSDSTLKLITKNETYVGDYIIDYTENGEAIYKTDTFDYTTGMLHSKKRYLYGIFEIRFKIEESKGNNFAFWVYGDNNREIDFFEIKGSEPEVANFNIHWDGDDPLTGSSQRPEKYTLINKTFEDNFNTISCTWDTNTIQWTVNNELVNHNLFNQFIWKRHIPNQALDLIITNEVGTLDGNPNSASKFPNTYEIDFVRVYQKPDTLAPRIIGQSIVSTSSPYFIIDMESLVVDDVYTTYPTGFTIQKQAGGDYTLMGDTIFIKTPTSKEFIEVPIRINDGIKTSNLWTYKIKLDPILSINKLEVDVNYSVKRNILYIETNEPIKFIKSYNLSGQEVLVRQHVVNNTATLRKPREQDILITIIKTNKGIKNIKW